MKKKTVYSDDENLSDSEDDKIKSINFETNNNISSDEEIISINVNKKQKKLNKHKLSHLNKPISKISVVEFSSDEDLLSDSDINDNINKTEITESISSN